MKTLITIARAAFAVVIGLHGAIALAQKASDDVDDHLLAAKAAAGLDFPGPLARLWANVLLTLLRWTCRLDYRVEGRENLPADASIALIKHSSSWETIAQAVLIATKRGWL